jgi:NifB/MoaA-like Fe-S oxidoreductase
MLDLPSTNGTKLTEGVIRQLEELKPIRVAVSLHSANPSIRKKVMRDPCPEVAIQSIPLLRKYRIQFGVGIVPWPTIPFKDVEETIRYADRYDPLEIQIQLPGFTRFGFESPPFDTREQWDTAIT